MSTEILKMKIRKRSKATGIKKWTVSTQEYLQLTRERQINIVGGFIDFPEITIKACYQTGLGNIVPDNVVLK